MEKKNLIKDIFSFFPKTRKEELIAISIAIAV
jgi:hypothetical protein